MIKEFKISKPELSRGVEIVYGWAADWVALIQCKVFTRVAPSIAHTPCGRPRLHPNVTD